MSNKLKLLGLLLACGLLLLSGCPNPSLMHGARTVGKGHHEFTSALGVTALDSRYLGGGGSADIITANAEAMYRGGVTDFFDIGVSLTGLGMVALDLKFEAYDSDLITLAFDPGIGGVFFGLGDVSSGYLQIQAPFMMDIHANDLLTVSLAAKYSGFYSFASAGDLGEEDAKVDAFTHWMGGTFGMRFNITEAFSLMPYGGFMMPVAGLPSSLDDITIWSAGLGFIYRR